MITRLRKIETWFFLALAALSFTAWITPPMALVLGFGLRLIWGHPFQEYNKTAVNWSLKIAVVGLGFGIFAEKALQAGSNGLLLTVGSIALTMLLGSYLGKKLKLNRRSSYLLSSGTAICGGSAIAAIAPIVKATDRDISMAMGTVFLLNSLALLLFPLIGTALELTQQQFGLWAAIAIHDTSSVVGAAATFGDEALEIATTVKLIRALWIIPLALVSTRLFQSEGKIKFPWFILLFVVAVLLNSFAGLPEALTSGISGLARKTLTFTLFLVGAGLSVEQIKKAGWRSLVLGISLWVAISLLSLAAILAW